MRVVCMGKSAVILTAAAATEAPRKSFCRSHGLLGGVRMARSGEDVYPL